jgi:site-specific DNA-methyltransferase (cytosine-N4-specific)
MLTDKGDMVVDPFGGSCVTGAVAEQMGRNWLCCELDEEYVEGAKGRFLAGDQIDVTQSGRSLAYEIYPPAFLLDEEESPLAQDGGKGRPNAKR